MKAYYCDTFVLPLPPGHRFPMAKYALLRQRVLGEGIVPPEDLRVPDAATDRELLRAHHPAWVAAVAEGTLTRAQARQIGFPWSPALVERSRRSVGGTLAAARSALQDGVAANLAGGTHHAHAAHGGGFCVFNDVAVAARAMQAEGRVRRLAILDCDVHQGDGTAAIFSGDPTVFTFSIHGDRNYPFQKVPGDLDVALPDGAGDGAYLGALDRALPLALDRARPDLALYVAGADPFVGDRLGRLHVSKAGLMERDRRVLAACAAAGVPVALVMAGGYAEDVRDTVDIHAATLRLATRHEGCGSGEWTGKRDRELRAEAKMTNEIQADGDRWRVGVDVHAPHPGTRSVVFHCLTNPQRPYRVAEVPASAVPSREALDQLSEEEMHRIFADSEPLDYTHDPRAAPEHIGQPPRPPGLRRPQ